MAAMLRVLLLAGVLAGSAAATAAAQAPIDLGPGRGPSAVVDAAGTAHIVFRSLDLPNATAHSVTYCRLPRRARACDVRAVMPLPAHPVTARIHRRAADGALIVAAADARDGVGTLWVSYSLDGGRTFTPMGALATGQDGATPVGLSPDGQGVVTLAAGDGGLRLWRSPFAAPDPRSLLVDRRVDPLAAFHQLAAIGGGRLLIASESGRGVAWTVFAGGDPLDGNAWTKRGTVRGQDGPVLAAGPRGVFLLDDRPPAFELIDRTAPFYVRRFDARRLRWSDRRPAGADQLGRDAADIPGHPTSDLAQDARGRLHLVRAARDSGNGECIQYARTGRRGWFGRTTTLFRTKRRRLQMEAPKVAAGPDGHGIVAWHSRHGLLAAEGSVHVVPTRQAKGRYRAVADPFERPQCGRRR
jgi:hypothetical protein